MVLTCPDGDADEDQREHRISCGQGGTPKVRSLAAIQVVDNNPSAPVMRFDAFCDTVINTATVAMKWLKVCGAQGRALSGATPMAMMETPRSSR